jgi:hypothetical protein
MFLQARAWTGKTDTIRATLSELSKKQILCLVSATIGIAAIQYPGRQTIRSLFCFDIDEWQNIFSITYRS